MDSSVSVGDDWSLPATPTDDSRTPQTHMPRGFRPKCLSCTATAGSGLRGDASSVPSSGGRYP